MWPHIQPDNQLLSQLWYINSATDICLYHTTDSLIAYTGLRACSTEIYLQARSSRQYLVHMHVESQSIVWSIFRFILCSSHVHLGHVSVSKLAGIV